MARLWDCNTFIRAAFSQTLKSLAMMTGNFLSPSKNAYSGWGEEECPSRDLLSASSFLIFTYVSSKFCSISSRMKSLPSMIEVGEVGINYRSSKVVEFPVEKFFVSPTLKVTVWSSCLKVIFSPCTSIKALAVLKNGLPKINGTLGVDIIVNYHKISRKIEEWPLIDAAPYRPGPSIHPILGNHTAMTTGSSTFGLLGWLDVFGTSVRKPPYPFVSLFSQLPPGSGI
ncbi:hypothetical protein Tco_1531626 [Tanacetum coccineum]